MPWPCAVHHLCCRPFPDHRKAPPRSPGLCRWPSSLPVIQTHSFHESNSLSHCHWKLCGRTEELDDFQHANGERQQDKILDCRKSTAARTRKHTIHSCGWGSDHTLDVSAKPGWDFDSNLKMDMQITKAWQNAYYHLHNIRIIRKFLSQEATCTIIHAFITSQIDYCNSLMNRLPENLLKKLQRVQNTAARLVFNLRKYDRITPALVTLHWLPVKYRIEFKTLLIIFKGLHGKAPTYI